MDSPEEKKPSNLLVSRRSSFEHFRNKRSAIRDRKKRNLADTSHILDQGRKRPPFVVSSDLMLTSKKLNQTLKLFGKKLYCNLRFSN